MYCQMADLRVYMDETVKVNLSLCLTKYHIMKIYPLLNLTPKHEDALEDWRYSSAHSQPRHQMEVSGQFHARTALTPEDRTAG